MLFNYQIGRLLSSTTKKNHSKKTILITGISFNVLLLGYFKYSDFFIQNFNFVFNSNITMLNLTLPLAISFFTFQQIAYLVDSYKKETDEYNILNYALFVTFFPQLIAGPIVHHKEMMPQFTSARSKKVDFDNVALGLFVFIIGLCKKVVIADTFAIWANQGFDIASSLTFFEAWATALSYTFQLYFDFSGYTDMAIGIALLFNIKLPINFNSPYKALDIQDFWRRWHITLSRFLRDYIYIPLGGNRKSKFNTYVNLMATFLIGGLWHGAGWTFIFWGFLHGFALVVNRIWKSLGLKLSKWLAWFITFNFVNIAWVFFRANSWADAIKVLKGMFTFNGIVFSESFISTFKYLLPYSSYFVFPEAVSKTSFITIHTLEMIMIGLFVSVFCKNSNTLNKQFYQYKNVPFAWYLFTICAFGISLMIMSAQTGSEFLYFNF